ncbi:MAG: hypothetical protein IT529_02450 [Burkholderiales bacterium]|nr:hypothetical protein [Burkholderiales bacterium]
MKRGNRRNAAAWFIVALAACVPAAADFEVTGPDGRRILLKDDGTWRHVEGRDQDAPAPREPAAPADKDKAGPAEKPKVAGEAVLSLERRDDVPGACRFAVRLANQFPYVIQSFVPTFSAVRANGVAYDSQNAGFIALRPGDAQVREVQFRGIACAEVARLQVSGGDRCVVGDLDRFSPADGECLKRVRVQASEVVRFDK